MNNLDIDGLKDQIATFCRKWSIIEVSLFGSVLRNDFKTTSDIDVLVRFEEQIQWSLSDLITMQDELGEIFGRDVDLVERQSVESSENYIRRRNILESMEPVYVAG